MYSENGNKCFNIPHAPVAVQNVVLWVETNGLRVQRNGSLKVAGLTSCRALVNLLEEEGFGGAGSGGDGCGVAEGFAAAGGVGQGFVAAGAATAIAVHFQLWAEMKKRELK